MEKKLISAYIKAQDLLANKREQLKNFGKDQSGMEMIAIVIIVAIVVMLGVAFKDQALGFVNQIWEQITGQASQFGGK